MLFQWDGVLGTGFPAGGPAGAKVQRREDKPAGRPLREELTEGWGGAGPRSRGRVFVLRAQGNHLRGKGWGLGHPPDSPAHLKLFVATPRPQPQRPCPRSLASASDHKRLLST